MTKGGFRRKLAAILSADVEGFSRLMGDDVLALAVLVEPNGKVVGLDT